MPPSLDIYVLTTKRNRPTVERFLDTYMDRAASEDRQDEELSIIALDDLGNPIRTEERGPWDNWTWEPALTLSHIVDSGLDYPRRAFTNYLASKINTIERVMLTFTMDNQLVLGLSIDDAGAQPENEQYARKLLDQLTDQFSASMGWIVVETPPPLSEGAFDEMKEASLTVHFWKKESP